MNFQKRKITLNTFILMMCLFVGVDKGICSTDSSEGSTKLDFEVWSHFISPVTTPAYKILGAGAILSSATLWYESSTNQQLQHDFSTSKPFGSSSKFFDLMGQWIPNAIYSIGMFSVGYFSEDKIEKYKRYQQAEFMFETTLYSSVVTSVLKVAFHQPRPDSSNRQSFPSGHSTTIFAFAGVIGLEHEWYYAVPAYTLATLVGLSRINDNKHYLHDVIAGASIGLSYVYGIWYNRHQSAQSKLNFFVIPTDDMQGGIASLRYKF